MHGKTTWQGFNGTIQDRMGEFTTVIFKSCAREFSRWKSHVQEVLPIFGIQIIWEEQCTDYYEIKIIKT